MESPHLHFAEGAESLSTTKRTRKKTSKSRQGCSRCKARRVKCDEVRPNCGNCLKLGCQCPGFEQQLRWSRKHERVSTAWAIRECLGPSNNHSPGPPRGYMSETEHVDAASQETTFSSALGTSNDGLQFTANTDPNWSSAPPTTWQATGLQPHTPMDGSGGWDRGTACGDHGASKWQYSPVAVPGPETLQTLTHVPTTLIEHWFRYICPRWSTFDSEVNYNRQLAWSSWTTSEAVFYTMQAMSAACLVDSMPQLNNLLPSLRALAAAAIDTGMSQVRMSQPPRVATDLVFAVFAMGTSSHCTTSALSDHPWLEFARELVSIWAAELSAPDALLHAYFCQALTYWEMLAIAVGRASIPAKLSGKLRKYQGRLRQAMRLPDDDDDAAFREPMPYDPGQNLLGSRPNSWCGVSNEVIDVFGQVLSLCRSACDLNERENTFTVAMSSSALCNISFAHELQRELIAMDFDTLILMDEAQGFIVQTRDDKTPISHLLQTAEAYRQAALLQLHLAFGDLGIVSRVRRGGRTDTLDEHQTSNTVESIPSRAEVLLELTLQLVRSLEKIPPESGSRSIHTMLYLSAAAGLRFDTSPELHHWASMDQTLDAADQSSDQNLEYPQYTGDMSCNTAQLGITSSPSDSVQVPGLFISKSNIEVSKARHLVWTRLSNLQQILPKATSDNTLEFVKTIWLEYDSSQSSRSSIHWLNIMKRTGLGKMLW